MIIVGALYRVIADVWALPALGQFLTTTYGLDFDYKNNLSSFGLIVICLAANQFVEDGSAARSTPVLLQHSGYLSAGCAMC